MKNYDEENLDFKSDLVEERILGWKMEFGCFELKKKRE